MASRLVPLLIAGTLAAAGCGASGMSSPTTPVAGSPQHGRPALAGPVRKAHATIWAVGDSAGGQDAASVAHLIERGRPDRLLYLGDVYPVGNAAGFRSYQSAYGSMRAITAPTPGNHDWLFRRSGYEPYWHNPPEWYSFTAAGWRIIELKSETTRGQAQLRWLRSQVHARGSCRTSASGGSSSTSIPDSSST